MERTQGVSRDSSLTSHPNNPLTLPSGGRDKRRDVKRPNYTDDEDLELINIIHSSPEGTIAQWAVMHNECMRTLTFGWRDRTDQV